MASSRSAQVMPAVPIALMVVGLGMVLIAGLAGVVLWLITRRRALPAPAANAAGSAELPGTEPAEA